MKAVSLTQEIASTSYPGRGIVLGRSADGTKAVIAYFIMGRSENSRNRVFVETEDGIKTEAFDPSKLVDPSLIIYAPVRVLGNKTIVTNGDQTDTIYDLMNQQLTFEQARRSQLHTAYFGYRQVLRRQDELRNVHPQERRRRPVLL